MAETEDYLSRREYQAAIYHFEQQQWLSIVIERILTTIIWANDECSLFYIKQDPQTLLPWQVWRHKVGTSLTDDPLV